MGMNSVVRVRLSLIQNSNTNELSQPGPCTLTVEWNWGRHEYPQSDCTSFHTLQWHHIQAIMSHAVVSRQWPTATLFLPTFFSRLVSKSLQKATMVLFTVNCLHVYDHKNVREWSYHIWAFLKVFNWSSRLSFCFQQEQISTSGAAWFNSHNDWAWHANHKLKDRLSSMLPGYYRYPVSITGDQTLAAGTVWESRNIEMKPKLTYDLAHITTVDL